MEQNPPAPPALKKARSPPSLARINSGEPFHFGADDDLGVSPSSFPPHERGSGSAVGSLDLLESSYDSAGFAEIDFLESSLEGDALSPAGARGAKASSLGSPARAAPPAVALAAAAAAAAGTLATSPSSAAGGSGVSRSDAGSSAPGSPGAAPRSWGSPPTLSSARMRGESRRRRRRRRSPWDYRWASYLAAGVNFEAQKGAHPLRKAGRLGSRRRRSRSLSISKHYDAAWSLSAPPTSSPSLTSSLSTSSAPGAAAAAAWAARPTRWAKYLTCGVVELMNTFPRHLPLGVCRHVLDFLAYDVATLVDLAAVNIAFRRLCREGRLWEKLDLSNRPLTDGFLWRLLRVAPLQHARGLNLSSLSRPSARLLAGCTKHTSPRLLRRSQESARDLTLEPLAEEAEKLFPTLGVGFSAQDRDAGAAPGAASAPQPDKLRLRLGMGLRLREIDVSNNRVITAEVLCAILSRTRGLANLVMTSADQVVNDEKLPLLTRAMTASGTRLRVLRMGTRTSRTQMQLKNLTRVSDDVCAQFLASVGAAAGMAMREHEGAEADGFFEMRSSGSPKRATRSSSEGLEVLSLYNQTLVSARTIHAITHTPTARTLRELDLSCCSRIADEMIEVVSRALPVLASLDVSNCWKITDAGLRCLRMAPHLSRTLHTLRLSGLNFITGSELSRVARQLHTLAHLTAARVPNVDDETLRELASSLGEAAKSFDFSHCDKITREGASALCLQCPNLESLVLAKCAQLNAEFLQDVAQICDGDAASSGAHEASASGLRRLLRRKDPLASLNHLNLREVRGFDDACLRAILLAKELAIKAGNEDVARLQKLLVGGTTYKSANWDAAEDESDVDLAASAAVGLSDAGMEFLASEPLLADALEVLDLEGHTGVSDRGVLLLVRRADRMRLLRLNGLRSLTNASIEAMLVPAVMPALAELHVAWCAGLTASVVESLKKSRPHLQLSLMKGRKLLPHHQ